MSESWVTVARNNLDLDAIQLALSVKKSGSTKCITILVDKNTSDEFRAYLGQMFDFVLVLPTAPKVLAPSTEKMTKFRFWHLEQFRKCVFIEPTSVLITNCDHWFLQDELTVVSAAEDSSPNGKRGLGFGFVFEPSVKKMTQLYEMAQENANLDENMVLQKYFGSLPSSGIRFLDASSLMTIGLKHELNAGLSNGKEDLRAEKLAIVGMSCRFPGSNDPEEFWNTLAMGIDAIGAYPIDRRRPPESFYIVDASQPDISAGYLKCPVDEFDAPFFGFSQRVASALDPQQRLLLQVTWEALENAGVNPLTLKHSNTAVFVGIWQQDYGHMMPNAGMTATDFHHRYLGNSFSATASRISHVLGLHGPALPIETGCSSSLGGFHLACETLRNGTSNMAISAGVNLVLIPTSPFSDIEDTIILSSRCKTFDESANGFVRAEGVASLILKRLADANRDGDNILGIVRGSAYNNDGDAISFGTPNAAAQIRVFEEALHKAGLAPGEISCIEAHGTGTVVGDPIEFSALAHVYSKGRKEPAFLSSVKSNIGHAEACAGLAGIVKVLQCFKHRAIPPHLHLTQLNSRINLDEMPAIIPRSLTPWTTLNKTRIAAISSFSMTGTNVHVLLEEPPLPAPPVHDPTATYHLVCISAKSDEALEDHRKQLLEYFTANPQLNAEDVAFVSNTCRAHFSHRTGLVGKDTAELTAVLRNQYYDTARVPVVSPKIGFLFSGQGSQYVGMGRVLYNSSRTFRQALDACGKAFHANFGVELTEVLWSVEEPDLLANTLYCQTVIFCLQYSLVVLWKAFGVEPAAVLGHSGGEFCAAVSAGVLSFEDAMRLVIGRSRLVQRLPEGMMVAVKTSHKMVQQLLSSFYADEAGGGGEAWLDIAAINSEDEIIVSAEPSAAGHFIAYCTRHGFKTQAIPSTAAYHSRHVDPILDELQRLASTMAHSDPACTYVSGTTGLQLTKKCQFDESYWRNHLRHPVRFSDGLKTMASQVEVLVEIGPQSILLGLAMANLQDSEHTFCPSLRKGHDDTKVLCTTLSKLYVSGVNIDWDDWLPRRPKRLQLPTYPFRKMKFWFSDDDRKVARNTKVHPLLGRRTPCASPDYYFNSTLNTSRLPYMLDHRIGDKPILPSAAYMEIMLAAYKEVLQMGTSQLPLTIRDYTVESAIEFVGDIELQTVVTASSTNAAGIEEITYKIAIHRQMDLSQPDKWKRHAQCTFVPTTRLEQHTSFDVEAFKAGHQSQPTFEPVYERMANIGAPFGPRFQNIKRAWYDSRQFLTETDLPPDWAKYVIHPIVLDSMIQTCCFRNSWLAGDEDLKLALPYSVQKFSLFPVKLTPILYNLTSLNTVEAPTIEMFTETGQLVARMEALELINTTLDTFLRSMRAESTTLPTFYEEVWRPVGGLTTGRVELAELLDVREGGTQVMGSSGDDQAAWGRLNELCFHFLLRSLAQLGLKKLVGQPLEKSDIEALLSERLPHRAKMAHDYFTLLQLNSIVCSTTSRLLSSISETGLTEDIHKLEAAIPHKDVAYQFVYRIGVHLTDVLQGKTSPNEMLYPTDKTEVGLVRLEAESDWYKNLTNLLTAATATTSAQLLNKSEEQQTAKDKKCVRILEIGGSELTTHRIVDKLSEMTGDNFEFTLTGTGGESMVADIEAKLAVGNRILHRSLDIEADPLTQGFGPASYDIVVAVMVLHKTADIRASLSHVHTLLREGGRLVLGELFQPENIFRFSFGLLNSWWGYKDFREGTGSPLLDAGKWERLLAEYGFELARSQLMPGNEGGVVTAKVGQTPESVRNTLRSHRKTWLLFREEAATNVVNCLGRKLAMAGRLVVHGNLSLDEGQQFTQIGPKDYELGWSSLADFQTLLHKILSNHETLEGVVYPWTSNEGRQPEQIQRLRSGGLFHLCQALLSLGSKLQMKPKVVVVTRGAHVIGEMSIGQPDAATVWGQMKVFHNESPDFNMCLVDLDLTRAGQECRIEMEELSALLWSRDSEHFTAIRNGKLFQQRLVQMEPPLPPLTIPSTGIYGVLVPSGASFTDITFTHAPKPPLHSVGIEVQICASALNFRDLFIVLKPSEFILRQSDSDQVGVDFSGVVSAVGGAVSKFAVGDEVVGFAVDGGTFGSHVITTDNTLFHKPKWMSHASAATLPCCFYTAHLALMTIAAMTSADRVLIHVATGGLGLAAIQLVNHIGAEIYATAGNERKRRYLRRLGVSHVYNSRSTDFGREILRDTDGRGVSIVLNSLTSPDFKETTLSTCGQGATFIELAKINIFSVHEVALRRPDVKYSVFDIIDTMFPREDASFATSTVDQVSKLVHDRIYYPLPYTHFPLEQLRQAFTYLKEAKHIGKVVFTNPVPSVSPGSEGQAQAPLVHHHFNVQGTYLISGGMGGIGLEITKWMTSVGARHIVLVGRSPPSEYARKIIDTLNRNGANIVALQADVGRLDECQQMLQIIENEPGLPPVKGVFHAAGIIADNFLANMPFEDHERALWPKVYGGWNLHNLTLDYGLECFVVFSTAGCCMGMLTQTNHIAANRFLDALAAHRHSIGLPGTTINWGIWSDVGAALKFTMDKENIIGVRSFNPTQGVAILDRVLKYRYLQSVVIDIEKLDLVKQLFAVGHYLDELTSDAQLAARSEEDAAKIINEIKSCSPEERPIKIKNYLEAVIRETLRIPDSEPLDPDQDLTTLGVDSLMAMEMRNRLKGLLGGKPLTITSFQEHRNLRSLAAHLTRLFNAEYSEPVNLLEQIVADAQLAEEIQIPCPYEARRSEIKSVLLTGATGHLGAHFLPGLTSKGIRVTCLVRASNRKAGEDKLTKTLSRYEIGDSVNTDLVEVVCGDVTDAQLGIDAGEYGRLAATIDAVIHCAIKVDQFDDYSDGSLNDMRTQNVIGLINVLRFVCAAKTKFLLHPSALIAAINTDEDGQLSEDYPKAEQSGEAIKHGYGLSKFIGEKLLGEAARRGLPITSIRYPVIMGHSVTGCLPPELNHAWLVISSSLKLQKIPFMHRIGGFPVIPVDVAADVGLYLLLNDEPETGIYNFTTDEILDDSTFKAIARSVGIEPEVIPFSEWRDALIATKDRSLVPFVATFYMEAEETLQAVQYHPLGNESFKLSLDGFSSKMKKNVPNIAGMLPPLGFLIRKHWENYLEKAKLNSI